jgi:hypothetical protein
MNTACESRSRSIERAECGQRLRDCLHSTGQISSGKRDRPRRGVIQLERGMGGASSVVVAVLVAIAVARTTMPNASARRSRQHARRFSRVAAAPPHGHADPVVGMHSDPHQPMHVRRGNVGQVELTTFGSPAVARAVARAMRPRRSTSTLELSRRWRLLRDEACATSSGGHDFVCADALSCRPSDSPGSIGMDAWLLPTGPVRAERANRIMINLRRSGRAWRPA